MAHHTDDSAAERILKLLDKELAKVPARKEETLRAVLEEMQTWLEAIEAGRAHTAREDARAKPPRRFR